jgi:hypothetical protein
MLTSTSVWTRPHLINFLPFAATRLGLVRSTILMRMLFLLSRRTSSVARNQNHNPNHNLSLSHTRRNVSQLHSLEMLAQSLIPLPKHCMKSGRTTPPHSSLQPWSQTVGTEEHRESYRFDHSLLYHFCPKPMLLHHHHLQRYHLLLTVFNAANYYPLFLIFLHR